MDKSSLFSSIGIAVICCLFFSSCSKEVEIRGDLPDGKYPMSFATSVKELRVTRSATVDGTWQKGDRIAVKVDGDANVKTYTPSANATSATLTSTDPFYWKKSDETKQVSAWYYGDNTFRDEIQDTWSVQADQNANDGYQKSDFLYAPSKEVPFADRAAANLAFYHQTARVVINIENADAATDANTIRSITIGNKDNLALSGAYTEPAGVNTTGTWDVSSGIPGMITPKEITPTGSSLKSYTALVIPQAMSEKANKKFIAVALTDGNTYYYTPENQDADLVPGQQYTFNITVKHGYLVVVAKVSGEWLDDGSTDVLGLKPFQTFTADELKPGDYFYRKDDGSWDTSDGGLRALYAEGYGEGYDVDNGSVNSRMYGFVQENILPDLARGECVGIVVKVGKDVTGDFIDNCDYKQMDGATPLSVRGYVLALNETKDVAWSKNNVAIGTYYNYSKVFYGYSDTKKIIDYATSKGQDLQTYFPAAYYATVGYEQAAPTTTSGWFLPALGQGAYWVKIQIVLLSGIRNATGQNDFSWLNEYDSPVGYWSSSEMKDGAGLAQVISASGGHGTNKYLQFSVRPWLAF